MNIIITRPTLTNAARAFPLRELGKQLLECMQMISVACHELRLPGPIKANGEPYSTKAHPHHPVTRWVCWGLPEAQWTAAYAYELGVEWALRTRRVHGSYASLQAMLSDWDHAAVPVVPDPESHIFCGDGVTSYGSLASVAALYADYVQSKPAWHNEEALA